MSAADDTQVREAACDPASSVLLQAPAGSGKTSVLTQRLLRLLGEVDEPEEILAITFTRKAAAEMRARVAGALRGHIPVAGAAGERLRELAAIASARSAQRGWNLLENPARLAIQTIDSFSFRLAAQLPLAARAGGALTITTHTNGLYFRAARQTLLAAEADRALASDIELLLVRLDNQWTHVETLLAAMLEKRAHWLRHVLSHDSATLCARVSASLRSLAESHLAAATRLLPAAFRARAAALPGTGTRDDERAGTRVGALVGALGPQSESLPAWQQLAALTLTAKGEWRSAKGINRTLGPAYGEAGAREGLRDVLEELSRVSGARELLCELAALPACSLKDEDSQALAALSRVLQVAAAELQAQLALAGRVDHTYVSGAAREALTEAGLPTELALRVGFALRHILVDEFQDTSLPQLELLAALTAGWEEGDGRSLFLVGDPMQSIYQFREAEVGLFLQARAHGIGNMRLMPLTLSRNFRARPELIQWINRTCGALFPVTDDVRDSAVRFTQSRPGAVTPDAAGLSEAAAPVRLALLPDRPSEAAWVAARIAALRAADAADSIAVLVSARSHARLILQALAARDIPAMGVDLTPLEDLPVIQDLVALTRALHHLGDRIAWLSVLRAPWCGLSLAALTALAQTPDGGTNGMSGPRHHTGHLLWDALQDPAHLAGCPQQDAVRLARVREVLQTALGARGRQPVAQWLEQVWLRLGAADAYPPEELPHAQAFFSALTESAASGEWRGPEDLEPLLAGLQPRPAAAADNPVQIMTVHRAKGLEFDHVLLPALDRAPARDREPLLRWLDLPRVSEGTGAAADSDLLMAPVPALDAEEAGEVGRYLKRLTQRRQQHEQLRLLYVALTRARHSLHLSASTPLRSDGSVRPRAQTLLGRLWPVVGHSFEICAAPEGPAAAAPRAARGRLRRLRAAWQPAQLPPAVEISSLPLGPPELEEREFSWVGETARHIGTVAHAALCELAGEVELPQEAAIRARCARYSAQLCRLGVPRAQLKEATGEVLQVLLRTLGDERGRWIFDRGHREAVSELALTGLVAGRLTSVVIDRCFVDAQGTRWVLDFKTSRHEGGGREAFLDREIERYRGQLTRYTALARGLGPEPVRAGLYFPLLQAFKELPSSGRRGRA